MLHHMPCSVGGGCYGGGKLLSLLPSSKAARNLCERHRKGPTTFRPIVSSKSSNLVERSRIVDDNRSVGWQSLSTPRPTATFTVLVAAVLCLAARVTCSRLQNLQPSRLGIVCWTLQSHLSGTKLWRVEQADMFPGLGRLQREFPKQCAIQAGPT